MVPRAPVSHILIPRGTHTVNSDNYRRLFLRSSIPEPAKAFAPLRIAFSNSVFRLIPEFEEEHRYEMDGES